MKVSKKRLIEIITEEIARTMKEVHGDWWTGGKYQGYRRDRNDPHHIHRAEAKPPPQRSSPEELAAVITGVIENSSCNSFASFEMSFPE